MCDKPKPIVTIISLFKPYINSVQGDVMDWFQLTKASVLSNFKNKENFSLVMSEKEYNLCLEFKAKYLDIYKDYHENISVLNNIFNIEIKDHYEKVNLETLTSWLCVFMLEDMGLCKVFTREIKEKTLIVTFIWNTQTSKASLKKIDRLENIL